MDVQKKKKKVFFSLERHGWEAIKVNVLGLEPWGQGVCCHVVDRKEGLAVEGGYI